MFKVQKIVATAAAAVLAASAANAASITVETFSLAAFNDYHAINNIIGYEDFEGFTAGTEGNIDSADTNVGSFVNIPAFGSGDSVVGTGSELAVKSLALGSGFGRENTTDGGFNWLDSNDNAGLNWFASAGGSLFNSVAFSLSDAADVGATLTVSADGSSLTSFVGQSDNTVDWVVISFGSAGVASAQITLENASINDGFGIDDVSIAAVPLPAGAALMLTGLGGLAIARRRKAAK